MFSFWIHNLIIALFCCFDIALLKWFLKCTSVYTIRLGCLFDAVKEKLPLGSHCHSRPKCWALSVFCLSWTRTSSWISTRCFCVLCTDICLGLVEDKNLNILGICTIWILCENQVLRAASDGENREVEQKVEEGEKKMKAATWV